MNNRSKKTQQNKIDNNKKKTDWLLCGLLTLLCKKRHNPKTSKIKNTEGEPTAQKKREEQHTKQRSEQKHHKPSTSEQKRGDKKKRSERERKESTRNKCQTNSHTILPTLFKISHNIYAPRQKIKRRCNKKNSPRSRPSTSRPSFPDFLPTRKNDGCCCHSSPDDQSPPDLIPTDSSSPSSSWSRQWYSPTRSSPTTRSNHLYSPAMDHHCP